MIRKTADLICIAAFLSLVSCASSPTPAPAAPQAKASQAEAAAPGKTASAPEPEKKLSQTLCHEKATGIELVKLGVPDTERPVDVGLSQSYVYVLFQPARLVRLTRGGGQMEVAMKLGGAEETWTAMDIDPTDGSVWIATEEFILRRITPTFALSSVKLQRVEGTGGFRDMAVARDAIYAAPACAEDGIWRIDRSGKILDSAFPMPENEAGAADEPARMDEMPGCNIVRIERDQNGRVLGWNLRDGVRQVDEKGAWSEGPTSLFDKLPASGVVRGVNVGEKSESWYLSRIPENLFFWKGQPVFVGNIAMRSYGIRLHDTALYLPEGERVREITEDCHGAYLIDVAADATGYVALTDRGLIFGDFATAPDLP